MGSEKNGMQPGNSIDGMVYILIIPAMEMPGHDS